MSLETRAISTLELVVGPYRSGKTRALVNELIDYCRVDPFGNALVVVPSARYRQLLDGIIKEALEQIGCPGILGLHILTFAEVCRLVLRNFSLSPRVIPDKLQLAVVGKVMQSMQEQQSLHVLSPIATLGGTHAAVLQLIDEFERCGYSPADVKLSLEKTASADSRYLELARIYEQYWLELDKLGCVDKKRLAFLSRELLFDNARTEYWFGKLAVDGFDRFSRLQSQVVKGLSRLSKQTQVLFDYCQRSLDDDYMWKESSYRELIDELGIAPPAIVDKAMHRPEASYVFSALDRFLEMQEIARRCKQSMVERGFKASQLLVVARQLKNYRGAVEAAFDNAQLPYFIDEPVDLRQLPVVQLIQRLLKLQAQDFPRPEVIACLRSPYFKLGELGLSPNIVDDIDQTSWKDGVLNGRSTWERCLQKRSQLWQQSMSRFFDKVTPEATQDSVTSFCSWFEDLLEGLLRLPAASKPDEGDLGPALIEVRKAINLLLQQESLFAQPHVSFETFVERFDSFIESSNYRPARSSPERITICGADLAPNRCFKEIFIAGLCEGEFPAGFSSSGFVSNDELEKWAGYGVPIDNPRHHPGFEAALFHSLIERATAAVHLSFPRYESSGEEIIPSFFLTQGKSEKESAIAFKDPYRQSIESPVSPGDAVGAWLWMNPAAALPAALLADSRIAQSWLQVEDRAAAAKSRVYGNRESIYNGYLVDMVQSGALAIPVPEAWSASRLNTYGQCPFRYWVSHVLNYKLKEQRKPGITPDLLGKTYHKALELFYKQQVDKNDPRLESIADQELDKVLQPAINQAIAWLESQSEFSQGEFWEFNKLDIAFRLKRFAKEEKKRFADDPQGFSPSKFEVMFGFDNPDSYPALQIDGSGAAIQLRGIIDRVDLAPAGQSACARVVDYKSSSGFISASEALSGRNLQLPIYALAVGSAILPQAKVAGAAYLSVTSGKAIGQFDSQSLPEILEQAQGHVRNFVEGITSGEFTVRPSHGKVCEQCDHRSICRVTELTSQETLDEPSD